MNEQLFTDGGDLDQTAGALENRHAQLFLQFLDLPGQRRLADEAGLGGFAEMAMLGYRQYITQVPQVQVFPVPRGGRYVAARPAQSTLRSISSFGWGSR